MRIFGTLVIIVRGSAADGLIGVAWGIFGLIHRSESLNVAIYNLANKKKWRMDMLQAAVQIALALLLLVDPVSKLYPHMRILGLELLAVGFHIFREIRAASCEGCRFKASFSMIFIPKAGYRKIMACIHRYGTKLPFCRGAVAFYCGWGCKYGQEEV